MIDTVTADGSGGWSVDYTGTTLPAGDHTFTATATDLAGNTSDVSASYVVTIDIAAPAAPVMTGISDDTGASTGDGVTSDRTLVLAGTAEAGSAVLVTRVGTGVIGTTTAGGSGNWSVDYTGTTLPAGDHTFTATATDLAGNTSDASASYVVTVDITAPAAPVMTGVSDDTGASSSDGVTNDRTLVLSGTAEAGSAVLVTRVGTGVIGAATANGSGNWTLDYTGTTLPAGDHAFNATATDLAGNVSPASASYVVTVDIAAPAAPVVTGVSDDTGASSSDGVTSDRTLVLSGTAEAGSAVIVTRVGTGVIGTVTADGSGNWKLDYTGTTLPAGDHTFNATATDLAGNTSDDSASYVVTVDVAAPTAPVVTGITTDTGASSSDGVTSDRTLALSGAAEAGSAVTVSRVGTGVIGTVTADGSGNWSLNYTGTTLPAGNHTFTATATDLAGNTSDDSASYVVTVDVAAPAAPAIEAVSDDTGDSTDDAVTSDRTLVLGGAAEAGSTVTVTRVGTGAIGAATADGSGAWSLDYTGTTLPAGDHTFTATATDLAGNTSGVSASYVVTVDVAAPAAPAIEAISDDTGGSSVDGVTSDRTLVVSGAAEAGSAVTVSRVGTGVIGTVTADGLGNWSLDYTGTTLPAGDHIFTATATDLAGNVSDASVSYVVTIDITAPTAPVVMGITTDTGDSSSDGVTSDRTLVLSGAAEAGSAVTVSRVGTGVIGAVTADGLGNWSLDYTGTTLPAGDHTFTATATDLAGNVSDASVSYVVTIDITAPAAPVVTGITTDTGVSSSDGVTSDRTLVLSGAAEAGSAVTVSRVGTGVIGTATADSSGNWSLDYTGTTLPAGDHTFTATATDLAGNASGASASYVVTIDIVAPAAPAIEAISDDTGDSTDDAVTSDRTLVLAGTAEAGSAVIVTRVGTGVIGAATADGSGDWSLDYTGTTLPAGDHTFTAAATDVAGNSSSVSSYVVTVDVAAPAAPAIEAISDDTGVAGDQITSDQTLALSGTAEAGSHVMVTRVGTGVIGTTTADGSGNWSLDDTSTTLPAGDHTFTATATDRAGNTSDISASYAVTIDTTAPAVPVVAAVSDDTGVSSSDRVTSDRTLVLSGTAEAGAAVMVTLVGTGAIGVATADGAGSWTLDHTSTTLPAGDHIFTATAVDLAGNASGPSDDFTVTIDLTVGELEITLPDRFEVAQHNMNLLAGIGVSYPGEVAPATLSVTRGLLFVDEAAAGLAAGELVGNGTDEVTISAPLHRIQSALANLSYYDDQAGDRTLWLEVVLGNSISQVAATEITVHSNQFPWHNTSEPADVNDDGLVITEDIVALIADLTLYNARVLDLPPAGGPPLFLDVVADNVFDTQDLIEVINVYVTSIEGTGESESMTPLAAMTISPPLANDVRRPRKRDPIRSPHPPALVIRPLPDVQTERSALHKRSVAEITGSTRLQELESSLDGKSDWLTDLATALAQDKANA